MSGNTDSSVAAFEAWIAKWGTYYKWANYIYVALKNEGQRNILTGRVELIASTGSHKINNLRVESTNLVAGRTLIPLVDKGFEKIRRILDGNVNIVDEEFILEPSSGGRFSYYFSPLYPSSIHNGPRRPTIAISGASRHDLLCRVGDQRELNWELRTLDTPYEDVEDLCSELGIPSFYLNSDACRFEISAYPVAGIGNSKITNGRALIQLWAAQGVDTSKIKFTYRFFYNGSVKRVGISSDKYAWQKHGDIRVGNLEFAVGDAPAVRGYLSFDDLALQDEWIEDPTRSFNLRYIVHSAVDRDRRVLNQCLSGMDEHGKYDAGAFEKGVAWLLHILGFSVSLYGDVPALKENADIHAVTPQQHHLVVECTVKGLGHKDKLSKVVERAELLIKHLAASGNRHVAVQPMIISASTREEIRADLKKAGEHKVVVITRAELDELIKRLPSQPEPDDLYEELLTHIPSFER